MIREPYGLNPYNITTDTSLFNDYSFLFSGDELESFKVEIAENNSQEDIQYISDYIHNPGVFNNEEVIFSLPNYITKGTTGKVWRTYKITSSGTDVFPTTFSSLKINGYYFDEIISQTTSEINFEGMYLIKDTGAGNTIRIEFLDINGEILSINTTASSEKISTKFIIDYNENYGISYSSYKIQIENKIFSITSGTYFNKKLTLTITSDTDNYIAATTNIPYVVYINEIDNSSGYSTNDYFSTKGKDLIWKIKMWENNAIFETSNTFSSSTTSSNPNIVNLNSDLTTLLTLCTEANLVNDKYIVNIEYNGEKRRIIALSNSDTTKGIINKPFSDLPNTGDSYVLSSNFNTTSENYASNFIKNGVVIKGKSTTKFESGVFVPLNESGTMGVSTTISVLKGDNLKVLTGTTVDIPKNSNLLNTDYTGLILEVERNEYTISSAADSTTDGYTTLTLSTTIGTIGKTYEYVIYFSSINSNLSETLTKTPYTFLDCYYFGISLNNLPIKKIIQYDYWEFSDGDLRGYITVESAYDAVPTTNKVFKIYSNFYNSSWYFFKSRKNPLIKITNPPTENWESRLYTFKGSYYQENNIPIKSHRWTIEDLNSSEEDPTIFDTGEIYSSNLECTYELFDESGNYKITLIITNQEDVVASVSINMNTSYEILVIDAKGTATINSNTHSVSVSWLNSIISEPKVVGTLLTYNNNISSTEQSLTIGDNSSLSYEVLAGAPININRKSFTLAAGLLINDNSQYYNSNIIELTPKNEGTSIILKKSGTDLFLSIDGSEYKFKDGLNNDFELLFGTFGQQATVLNTNEKISKDYDWMESTNAWQETHYWTETSSDMNCYYYEIFIRSSGANLFRYAKSKGTTGYATSTTTLTVPFDQSINDIGFSSCKVKIGDNDYIISSGIKNNNNTMTLTLTNGDLVEGTSDIQYLIYQVTPTQFSVSYNTLTDRYYGSIILNSNITIKYLTLYVEDIGNTNISNGYGISPAWDINKMRINCNYNGNYLSSYIQSGNKSIIGYKLYRNKYSLDGNTLISSTLISQIDLDETISDSIGIDVIDWTVGNRGYYDYSIIPLAKTIYSQNAIFTNKIYVEWYGWSFTSIGQISENNYMPIEQWIFNLNLSTDGYKHNTNKVYHQGFSAYPKVSIGLTDYITTTLSCLIGDLESYTINNVFSKYGYKNDTIDKITSWKQFSNSNELIMVKDLKGNVFIGSIDGNSFTFEDVGDEILTNLSFSITQINSMENFKVFSNSQNTNPLIYRTIDDLLAYEGENYFVGG